MVGILKGGEKKDKETGRRAGPGVSLVVAHQGSGLAVVSPGPRLCCAVLPAAPSRLNGLEQGWSARGGAHRPGG